jgi:hypothetical protein
MTPNVPILAWSPDTDPTVPGVLTDVENLLPTERSYAPDFALAAPAEWAVTLPGECYGIAGLTYQNQGTAIYFATGSDLHYTVGPSYATVTRSAGPYSMVTANMPWRFAAFRDATIAVHPVNATQSTPVHGFLFSDLAGAPKAATIAVQRNFVILGAIDDGAYKPDGWACSALEDYTDWTPDIATQAATGRLTATQGAIVRLIPFGDYVIAFKARSMYRGQYVGAASNTWSWPVVSTDVGLISHDAVCEADGVLYWMGEDGFYRWAGGGQPQRIATAPWRWLRSRLESGTPTNPRVEAVWDSVRRCVRWFIHVARTGFAGPYCLAYHVDTGRWGRTDINVQRAFQLPSATVASVETAALLAKAAVPGYVDGLSVSIQTHAGDPLSSSFTSGDIGDDDQVFALTRTRLRYLTAPSSSYATHYHRMNLGEALTTGDWTSQVDGKYDFSQSARWHRVQFSQTGRYEVVGMQVEVPRAGRR